MTSGLFFLDHWNERAGGWCILDEWEIEQFLRGRPLLPVKLYGQFEKFFELFARTFGNAGRTFLHVIFSNPALIWQDSK